MAFRPQKCCVIANGAIYIYIYMVVYGSHAFHSKKGDALLMRTKIWLFWMEGTSAIMMIMHGNRYKWYLQDYDDNDDEDEDNYNDDDDDDVDDDDNDDNDDVNSKWP